MSYNRYGVYYAPPSGSPLAEFGDSWLGWDAEAGENVAHLDAPVDVHAITTTPRKYGFHGTLKPPFRLTGDPAALFSALEDLAASQAPFQTPPLRLSRIGPFLALTLSGPSSDLAKLAAACVEALDPFRAQPTEAELAKRRAAGLTDAQDALLLRWGYPYVMEEFRFHLTLTGALDDTTAEAALDALTPLTEPHCQNPLDVRELTLFGEAEDGRFHIVRRFPLGR
ncbi:MAG: DUF1045 domain-containing protein [Pseudomonadota bacterium]